MRIKLIAEHILDERELDFFVSRYDLDNILKNKIVRRVSLQEIGDRAGLTRERIRQIEKNCLEKIKSVYTDFPYGEIPKSYLTPIPETFKNTGRKKYYQKSVKDLRTMGSMLLGNWRVKDYWMVALIPF